MKQTHDPWKRIWRDLLGAQISAGLVKFTYLEMYVFVMMRMSAEGDGQLVIKDVMQHNSESRR